MLIGEFPCFFHYTRAITSRCVASSGIHLRGIAPGRHNSEETWQRWQAVRDTASIQPTRESNPKPYATYNLHGVWPPKYAHDYLS